MSFTGNVSLLVAAPMLQDYLVDKTLGTPLAAGIVTFYEDNSRTTLKPVYYQTGVPGAYTYTELDNPLTLSSVGTIQNPLGEDVIPFFYPYDENEQPDPYYVTVEDSSNLSQFTRENFPFVAPENSSDTGDQLLLNFIPNPQFLSHNDLPVSNTVQNGTSQVTAVSEGSTTADSTNTSVIVAQGGAIGWYFIKSSTSTSTDKIIFDALPADEAPTLSGDPRFVIEVNCTSPNNTDSFKELRVRFNNVNRFAEDSQTYTFAFSGTNVNSGTVPITLKLLRYFGTGGSAAVFSDLSPFSLMQNTYIDPNTNALYSVSFQFPSNAGKTLGSDNDDYFEFIIAFPPTSTFDIKLTNFVLTPGNSNVNIFPQRPDNETLANGVSGSMPVPNPDGSDLYLPLILTRSGVTFDHTQVGKIYASFSETAETGELLCDGSQYDASLTSSDGIPYSRLFNKLYNSTLKAPIFGTGANYVNCYVSTGLNTQLILNLNKIGSQTVPADGSPSTGFTFNPVVFTGTSTIKYNAYADGQGNLTAIMTGALSPTNGSTGVGAGTSGFTVSDYNDPAGSGYRYAFFVTPVAAAGLAGTYFTFRNNSTNYYMWFKVDGVGADPAPGGTGIQVNLLSTMSALDVAIIVSNAISSFQVYDITCVAAGSVNQSSYFNFTANSLKYTVWYNKGGAGTQPVVVGTSKYIEVDIGTTDTANQVAVATQAAINSVFFAVPDLRGMFLRGLDSNGTYDLDISNRYGYLSNITTIPGAFEFEKFLSHNHGLNGSTDTSAGEFAQRSSVNNHTSTTALTYTGGNETRPVNASVNWFIKY